MASQAKAYREMPGSARENLSPFQLKQLVRYSGIPLPQRHLILAALEVSNDAGVVIWSSVKSLSVETKMSERTIYHRRRRMLKLKLWEPIRKPYTWDDCPKCGAERESKRCGCGYQGSEREFRRPPTFRLNVDKIAAWPRPKGVRAGSYRQYKASPDYPGKKHADNSGHRSTSHFSPSNERAKQEAVSAKPALVESSAAPVEQQAHVVPSHRSTERPLRRLTPREGPKLIAEMRRLMQGVTRENGLRELTPRGMFELEPADPRYRAPMSQQEALASACMNLGIPYESAREHLKLCRFPGESEQPEGP
jgi:hypothetical protein